MRNSRTHRTSRFAIWVVLLTTLLLPLLIAAQTSIVPVGRETDEGWKKRFELIERERSEVSSRCKIVFVGDSITDGWRNEGKEVWAKYYQDRDALNLGIGGEQTQNILWRLDHGNIDRIDPKLAVLLIGTNNIFFGSTVSDTAKGIKAVVAKLREKLPKTKILLFGIFPRGAAPNNMRGDVLQVNEIIKRLADGKTVIWMDIGDRFVDTDGTISKEIMWDALHLTSKGYEIWAEAMEDTIWSILEDRRHQ